VPEALRAAGLDVRVHDELFPQGTEDLVWLTEAGAHRWVVITRDDRIRYNQLEKQAVLAARLRFFSITSSSLTGDEAGALILSALGKMSRLCRQHSKLGFIAKISRGPDVKIIGKSRSRTR
jgi:PIN like domain